MPNMRIITTNVADTAATLTCTLASNGNTLTPAAGSLTHLQNDYKSQFVSVSDAAAFNFNLAWAASPAAAQTIGGVVLPCTNLSIGATIQVTLYSDTAFTTAIATTSAISACTNSPIASLTTVIGPTGSLFQLGVLSKAAYWFPTNIANVRSMRITISDTSNPATTIDCARIVCGPYWQPTYNASRDGLTLGVTDTSTNSRTDAGELVSDRGFLHDELSLNLALLTNTDRDNLLQLTRTVGVNRNILVSVFPTDYNASGPNNTTEQQYTVYGKRSNNQFNYVINGYGSSNLQITGW
jgi:hypothetical protein